MLSPGTAPEADLQACTRWKDSPHVVSIFLTFLLGYRICIQVGSVSQILYYYSGKIVSFSIVISYSVTSLEAQHSLNSNFRKYGEIVRLITPIIPLFLVACSMSREFFSWKPLVVRSLWC